MKITPDTITTDSLVRVHDEALAAVQQIRQISLLADSGEIDPAEASKRLAEALAPLQIEAAPVELRNPSPNVLGVMRGFGGSFAHALAISAGVADLENRSRIIAAFPEIFANYDAMCEKGGESCQQ